MSNDEISLEERMDAQLRAFGYTATADEDERQGVSGPRMAVRGAGAAALGAGGVAAYRHREALAGGGKDIARKGLKKTARAAGVASNQLHRTALRSGGLLMKGAAAGSNVLAGVSRKLRGVAKSFGSAEVGAILDLAARIARIELEAQEDGLVDFRDYGGQRDPMAIQYIGQSGTGYFGGREALKARDKYKDAGTVYRKRDAAADAGKGAGASAAILAGGVGAGVLGSRALMKATAAGKVPKGPLRKGAVKASQLLKKAGRSHKVAVGGVLGAGLAGTVGGLAVQRKSAERRLRKRQQED